MTTPINTLLPLVNGLKACPTRDSGFSEKRLIETWNCLRRVDPEHGDEITPALVAGLVLYDEEQFAKLLNAAERSQLVALARTALDRYQQLTQPPNKLGRLIAGSMKGTP